MAKLINYILPDWWAKDGKSSNLDNLMSGIRPLIGDVYIRAGLKVRGGSGQLPNGLGSKFAPSGISHFVVINVTSAQWNLPDSSSSGLPELKWKWVRVFNPFDNDTEYYSWGDLKSSWEAENSQYIYVQRRT